MFIKKDKLRYTSGCADKHPDELPGVRKNHLFSLLPVEKYGLSIWTEYTNIPSLPSKSYAGIRPYFVVHPLRDISPLSSTKPLLRNN